VIGAVFDMPAFPAGWDESSAQLIRIIDPLGEAIAWFAPELGACCAGYAVREVGSSSHSRALWRDIIIRSTANQAVTSGENDDDAPDSRWRFVDRDPASCTLDRTLVRGSRVAHWRMTAALTDARLSLFLLVHNAGIEPIQAGARLRVALSSPPRIAARLADDASRACPDATATEQNTGRQIVLTVDADPGPGTVLTESAHEATTCTIADHRLKDSLPVILPGEFRRLSVLIGS